MGDDRVCRLLVQRSRLRNALAEAQAEAATLRRVIEGWHHYYSDLPEILGKQGIKAAELLAQGKGALVPGAGATLLTELHDLRRVAVTAAWVLDPSLAFDWRILTDRAARRFRELQDALRPLRAPPAATMTG